jgi:hypothetical protein
MSSPYQAQTQVPIPNRIPIPFPYPSPIQILASPSIRSPYLRPFTDRLLMLLFRRRNVTIV